MYPGTFSTVLLYYAYGNTSACISAAVTTMIMLVVAKLLSAAELFLADYSFLYENYLLYQCTVWVYWYCDR